jgi:heme/copper-type cytochrome/quinol oxidase subunit 3
MATPSAPSTLAGAASSTLVESVPHGTTSAHIGLLTPGKIAIWLFLATEIMFFTGLIGSYIVLRAGSPSTSYSNLYVPTTAFDEMEGSAGVLIESVGHGDAHAQAEKLITAATGWKAEEVENVLHGVPHGIVSNLTPEEAETLAKQLSAVGAVAKVELLETHSWPKPYDEFTNPLSIDLTAGNTFILICSSLTMVLALSAIQEGKKSKGTAFLLATALIGTVFVSVQVYEYYQLMLGHHYPPGISATGHFRPSVSLFASCFFTMTGFHGAHVTGGVIALFVLVFQSLRGVYSATNYHTVEYIGLYWHFVDLVWIILFTIVYLI